MLTSRLKSTFSTAATTITYQTSVDSGTATASYTFSNVAIGGPGLIVVAVQSEGGINFNNNLSSATIGGVTATLVSNTVVNYAYSGIISAVITSGTTATITLSFVNSQNRCAIGVWRIQNYSSATAITSGNASTIDNSTGNTVTLSSLPSGAVVVAGYVLGSQNIRVTWTNITERYDRDIASSNTGASGGDSVTTSSGNFSVSTSNATSLQTTVLAAAAWQ